MRRFIYVCKREDEEIVYSEGKFYVNVVKNHNFDIQKNWIYLFVLLVTIEGSIWLSQFFEEFLLNHKVVVIVAIVVSIYVALKLSRLLEKKLKIGYQREDLKKVRTSVDIDDEMVIECQKKYVSYTMKQVALLLFAAFLYSIFYFTFRLYGVICGMYMMTAFFLLRITSNYQVYREFMDIYNKKDIRKKSQEKREIENKKIVESGTKKRSS